MSATPVAPDPHSPSGTRWTIFKEVSKTQSAYKAPMPSFRSLQRYGQHPPAAYRHRSSPARTVRRHQRSLRRVPEASPGFSDAHPFITLPHSSTKTAIKCENNSGSRRAYLKPTVEMARLFSRYPEALARTVEIADRCRFSMDELAYQYPAEKTMPGLTAQQALENHLGRCCSPLSRGRARQGR
jgi:hypothetical protein